LSKAGQASSPPSPPSPVRGRRCHPTEGRMTDEGAVDASPLRTSGSAATQTMPRLRSRYKVRNPKHPRQSRKRKRRQ
jgi:hypothetical protein